MADTFFREIHCLLGLPFDAVDLSAAVRRVRGSIVRRERCFFSTPNVNWLVSSLEDEEFRNSVVDSDLSICDGMPLVWIARLLGIPIRERVTGASLFEELRKETTTRTAVYFFGGPPGVAEDSCARLNSAAEGMYCAGFECPGFGSIEAMSSAASIAKINDSGADLLVVALGAKKGQAWIERNRARLSVPAVSHLGAVVNFVAGTIERAPAWMQRSGLEWLWRIKQEPGLARRYLSDGVRFLSVVATRALPHAWFNVWNRPGLREVDSSAFDVDSGGDEFSIRLRGAWVRENLGPLRECFARASLAARNIRIDLEGVSYVDSAFVGLILLLSGHCRRQGRSFSLIRAGKAVRRLLRLSCVDYLLAAEDEQRLA